MLEGDERPDEEADKEWAQANTILVPVLPDRATDLAAANTAQGSSSADVMAQGSANEEAPSTKRQRRSPPANIARLRDTIQSAVRERDSMPEFAAAGVEPIAAFNPSIHAAMTRIIAARDVVERNLVTLHDLDAVSPLQNYDEEYARLTDKLSKCNRSL